MNTHDSKWLVDLINSHVELLEGFDQFLEYASGNNAGKRELANAYKAMRATLEALDIGDCDSGGDYHSSALGKHVNPSDGGKSLCPACHIREHLRRFGLIKPDGSYIEL